MARCFLSYSGSYRSLMEAVRRLLHVLGFEVDVFDEPDLDRSPPALVRQRIAAAECMVLLLGPSEPETARQASKPAEWPMTEGLYALGTGIPIALVIHRGTAIPGPLGDQTPVHFDFWNAQSFVENVHNLVKHLLDLKRGIDLPAGHHEFVYRKVVVRHRIQADVDYAEFYHEVVAQQRCGEFHHLIDTGMDRRAGAAVRLARDGACSVNATLDPGQHHLSLRLGEVTQRAIPYTVRVDPPLQFGEELGYLRNFEIENYFPLDRETLLRWAGEPGFPGLYRTRDQVFYGEEYHVFYPIDSISIELHLPRGVPVRSTWAFAYSEGTERINEAETQRCNAPECRTTSDSPDRSDRIVKLHVRHPLINHRYGLLYEL